MIKILDKTGHNKIATIEDDKTVRASGKTIGHVETSGEVFDQKNEKVGRVRFSDGYVFNYQNSPVGSVHSDGRVFDYQNNPVGKIDGEPMGLGGAALLLLVLAE